MDGERKGMLWCREPFLLRRVLTSQFLGSKKSGDEKTGDEPPCGVRRDSARSGRVHSEAKGLAGAVVLGLPWDWWPGAWIFLGDLRTQVSPPFFFWGGSLMVFVLAFFLKGFHVFELLA